MFTPDLLSGKHALVTGGGSGLGLTMTRKYLELGAAVTIIGRSEERLAQAAAQLNAPERLLTRACDVRVADQVEAMLQSVYGDAGAPDIVVNNAVTKRRSISTFIKCPSNQKIPVTTNTSWKSAIIALMP